MTYPQPTKPPSFTPKDIKQIQDLMKEFTGITLGENKKSLIVSRLSNHIRKKGFSTFQEYIVFLKKNTKEKQAFIDILTTNETYFFREKKQLDLIQKILPTLQEPIYLWSAACSSGEEAYTLAMLCAHTVPTLKWKIYASDVNQEMLQTAQQGIYLNQRLEQVPKHFLQKYFLKGIHENQGKVAMVPFLKQRLHFFQHNLLETLSLDIQFSIIFLKNVLIYFKEHEKKEILQKTIQQLKPKGYVCVGMAESLSAFSLPLKHLMYSVYQYDPR